MPLAMAALGHIIWGFSVLFSKVAMEVAQPDVLLSIRFLLSALLMTLMILFGKAKLSLRGKNLKPLLLLAVTEPMYFYFESYGILYTNATFAGVVLAVAPAVAIPHPPPGRVLSAAGGGRHADDGLRQLHGYHSPSGRGVPDGRLPDLRRV